MSTKSAEHVAKELKRAKILATAIRTNAPSVVPELNRQNASVTREGETMIEAAVEQERNARLLDQGSLELNQAGRDVRDAIAERVHFAEERDMWFTVARGELFSVKAGVQAQGGKDAVYKLGLHGPLAESPEKLILQGQHAQLRLADSVDLRTKAKRGSIDNASLGERLSTPFAELELNQDLFLEADQNAATAQKAKDDAYDRLRLLNLTIGQETVAAWRRAGFRAQALRLRRRLYRVLRSAGSGNTTAPPATDQDGADAPPTPDAPPPSTAPDTGSTDPGTVTEAPDATSSASDTTTA